MKLSAAKHAQMYCIKAYASHKEIKERGLFLSALHYFIPEMGCKMNVKNIISIFAGCFGWPSVPSYCSRRS